MKRKKLIFLQICKNFISKQKGIICTHKKWYVKTWPIHTLFNDNKQDKLYESNVLKLKTARQESPFKKALTLKTIPRSLLSNFVEPQEPGKGTLPIFNCSWLKHMNYLNLSLFTKNIDWKVILVSPGTIKRKVLAPMPYPTDSVKVHPVQNSSSFKVYNIAFGSSTSHFIFVST